MNKVTTKLIGHARVSTGGQDSDRQDTDLLAAVVLSADLHSDYGVSGTRDKRPGLNASRAKLCAGSALVITTLDRLGCLA